MTRVIKFKEYPHDYYIFKDGWVFSYFLLGNRLVKRRSTLSQNDILRHVGPRDTLPLQESSEEELLKSIILFGILESE